MRKLLSLLVALVIGVGLKAAPAPVLTKGCVSLALAKRIGAAAEAEAAKNHWPMVIVVLDDGGNLVYFERMDGAQLGSIAVAEEKAKTALYFRRPTKAYQDRVAQGANVILSVPNIIAIEGGLPLIVNGQVIGSIGASGPLPAEDEKVAEAGAGALAAP